MGKAFLVCGITNSLDGTGNGLTQCAKELPTVKLAYANESSDDTVCFVVLLTLRTSILASMVVTMMIVILHE